jgi:hypothetical protein
MSATKARLDRVVWSEEEAQGEWAIEAVARSDRSRRSLDQRGCADPAAPKVTDYARGPVEALAIAVARAHLALQVHGTYACLEAVHLLAETQFEATFAADFVSRITLLLRSLRQERQTPFAFLPVNWRAITCDERDFLLALQAAAACDIAAIGERAERLTQGGAPIRTSLALGWLAALVVEATGRPTSGLLN